MFRDPPHMVQIKDEEAAVGDGSEIMRNSVYSV